MLTRDTIQPPPLSTPGPAWPALAALTALAAAGTLAASAGPSHAAPPLLTPSVVVVPATDEPDELEAPVERVAETAPATRGPAAAAAEAGAGAGAGAEVRTPAGVVTLEAALAEPAVSAERVLVVDGRRAKGGDDAASTVVVEAQPPQAPPKDALDRELDRPRRISIGAGAERWAETLTGGDRGRHREGTAFRMDLGVQIMTRRGEHVLTLRGVAGEGDPGEVESVPYAVETSYAYTHRLIDWWGGRLQVLLGLSNTIRLSETPDGALESRTRLRYDFSPRVAAAFHPFRRWHLEAWLEVPLVGWRESWSGGRDDPDVSELRTIEDALEVRGEARIRWDAAGPLQVLVTYAFDFGHHHGGVALDTASHSVSVGAQLAF